MSAVLDDFDYVTLYVHSCLCYFIMKLKECTVRRQVLFGGFIRRNWIYGAWKTKYAT